MDSRKIKPALNPQLITAVEAGEESKVKELLEAGADPNSVVSTFRRNHEYRSLDEDERHLLHVAVELDQIKILEHLLNHGANPALKNNHGLTSIQLAIQQHNVGAICTFAKFVPLHPSILGEALWHVVAHHSIDCAPIVKILLEQGADPNISAELLGARRDSKETLTSLSVAARYCSSEVATLLLQYGADSKDIKIHNEKKQKAFSELYSKVSKEPNFESEKQQHQIEREAKAKKAEAFELEHAQREEARRLDDVQKQIDAFVKIYTALREGQSGLIKTNFLTTLRLLTPDEKLAAIKKHAFEKNDSRTANAWVLAQKYGEKCDSKNVDLIAHIYHWSYERSGLFKKSRVSGVTLFNQAGHFAVQIVALMKAEAISNFADTNPDSRTAKILRALR